MSKKLLFNPVLGSYELLHKSYNRVKRTGHAFITEFKEYLEDDDVKRLLGVKSSEFESFRFEIFDLLFEVRLEIDIKPEFNAIRKGRIALYLVRMDSLLQTGIEYYYDEDRKVYRDGKMLENYHDMSDLVMDFLETLINHITAKGYTTLPNASYEGSL